jgi:hypothetical protein
MVGLSALHQLIQNKASLQKGAFFLRQLQPIVMAGATFVTAQIAAQEIAIESMQRFL